MGSTRAMNSKLLTIACFALAFSTLDTTRADLVFAFETETVGGKSATGEIHIDASFQLTGAPSCTIANGCILSHSFTADGVTDTAAPFLPLDLILVGSPTTPSIAGINGQFLSGPALAEVIVFDGIGTVNGSITGTFFDSAVSMVMAQTFFEGRFTAVPEPSSFILLGLLTVLLAGFRWISRRTIISNLKAS